MLTVPPPQRPLSGGRKDERRRAIGLGIGETPSFADSSVSDGSSMRGGMSRMGERDMSSPTQWSSEGEPRMSSDGSSLGRGQWNEAPVQGSRWR